VRDAAAGPDLERDAAMPEDERKSAATFPRTLVALGVGLLTFVVLSSLRIRVQILAPQPAAAAVTLTLLGYLVSGFATGLFLRRAHARLGALLGLLTVAVVWLEAPPGSERLHMADRVAAFLAFAALGVVACSAGCWAAGLLRARRGRVAG
jgi:hypothetical protein